MMIDPLQPRRDNMGKDPTLSYKTALLIIVFLALAVSHATEVFLRIFRRFRSYRGVYFWSLIAASLGIIVHAFGFFLRNFDISNSVALETLMACGGGLPMITGQSIVLWSRLHLISPGKKDWWLLWMIIADCVIIQGGATVLFAGSNAGASPMFLKIYEKWEIVQVTWFFIQECLISGLYIYRTFILMRSSATFRGPEAKRVLHHLIGVNIIIISFDVTILALQYAGLYAIQTSWKTFAYAIKLRFEFNILNQLVDFTKAGFATGHGRSSSRHITGSGENKATVAQESIGGSRFGNSTYTKMEEDGVTGVPLQQVVKTTRIQVSIEQDTDARSESSTKELRQKNDSSV